VSTSSDDGNEDGGFDGASSTIWFGTGNTVNDSYTALRFQNVDLPASASIEAAVLEARSSETTSLRAPTELFGEAADSCKAYSGGQRPSKRTFTAAKSVLDPSDAWQADEWLPIADVTEPVSEVLSRPGWKAGNALCIIGRGTGAPSERRFVVSFDGSATDATQLRITYSAP